MKNEEMVAERGKYRLGLFVRLVDIGGEFGPWVRTGGQLVAELCFEQALRRNILKRSCVS